MNYYWCLRHNRVENDDDMCDATQRLGPYSSPAEAEAALEKVNERNESWDAEDERWHGERD